MSAHRFGVMAFAILGIYFIVTAIVQAPNLWVLWETTRPESGSLIDRQLAITIGASAGILLYAIAGFILARYRNTIAAWAVGEDEPSEPKNEAGILPMAYSVLGVWLVANYGPGVATTIPYLAWEEDVYYVDLVTQSVVVLIGLLLFFRSEWLARFWSRRGSGGPEASARSVASRWSRAGKKRNDDSGE